MSHYLQMENDEDEVVGGMRLIALMMLAVLVTIMVVVVWSIREHAKPDSIKERVVYDDGRK